MSQMSIPSQPIGPSLGVPAATPVAPTLSPPPATPQATAPVMQADQNQVTAQTNGVGDMGALPWDAEDLATPATIFQDTPEYQALSVADRQKVDNFFAAATPEGTAPEKAAEVAQQVATLLQHDRLDATDAFGTRVIDHLDTLTKSPLAQALRGQTTKAELAQDLLKALSDPASLTQGVDTLDCAEATLEATLAYSQPGDFARIATQLATKGSATIPGAPSTPGNEQMPLVMLGERAERNMLSHMMQGSFKAKVDGRSPVELKNLDKAGKLEKEGLDSRKVKMLYDGITGKDHLTLYAADGVNLVPALRKALENSDSGVVKVTMRSDSGLHAVAVTGFSDEGVNIWDPATGEAKVMPKEEFNSLLVRATVDREALDKGKRNERDRTTRNEVDRAVVTATNLESQVSEVEQNFNTAFSKLTQGIKKFFGKLGDLFGNEGGGRVGGSASRR